MSSRQDVREKWQAYINASALFDLLPKEDKPIQNMIIEKAYAQYKEAKDAHAMVKVRT